MHIQRAIQCSHGVTMSRVVDTSSGGRTRRVNDTHGVDCWVVDDQTLNDPSKKRYTRTSGEVHAMQQGKQAHNCHQFATCFNLYLTEIDESHAEPTISATSAATKESQ